jgi:hypothetical protein
MDFHVLATLAFCFAGGALAAAAAGLLYRAFCFRRSAVRATATVVEGYTQAIKSQPLESFYRADEPRPAARGAARTIHAHRTRWVRLAYEDEAGNTREVRQQVLSGTYDPGQQLAVLYSPQQPGTVRIDAPLELYGRGLVIGALALLFLLGGAFVWWEVIPVAGR